MKRHTWLVAALAMLGLAAGAAPAWAEDLGIRLDLGGRMVTRASNNGSGIGGGAALTFIFPQTPVGVTVGLNYLKMTNLPTGTTGSIVDIPVQVSYHFLNSAPNLDTYLYVANDFEVVTANAGGATTTQFQALNPGFGAGLRWFFAPQFGVRLTAGGRMALENGSTFQFVSDIGTSFRF